MYTQCPECNSIFEVTAANLAVAGGFVRCGQCTESFDALKTLCDSSESLQAPPGPSRAKATLDSVKSRSAATKAQVHKSKPAEAETRADSTSGTTNQADQPESADDSIDPDTAAAIPPDAASVGAETETDSEVGAKPDDPAGAGPEPDTDTDRDESPLADSEADPADAGPEPGTDTDRDESLLADSEADPAGAGPEPGTDTDRDESPLPDGEADPAGAGPDRGTDTDRDESLLADGEADAATLSEEVDDDEILLDDAYRPPSADDDDEYYEDDELPADDEFDDTPVPADGEGEKTDGNEDGQNFLAEEADIASPEEAVIEPTDEPDADDVDESALFTLPLPELTPLEHTERGILPEKLEGGEAAFDPSAQSKRQPEPRHDATDIPASVAAPARIRANDAFDAEDARDLKNYLKAPVNRAVNAAWIGGSVLMALLLAGQIIHRNRGNLVIHPRLGPAVESLYKTAGVQLRPNWKINDYKVVGQARLFSIPLDDTAAGTDTSDAPDEFSRAIRFVTIITNAANMPQPAPMVRLTLRDRWGDAIGARDFTPPEYLADRAMIGQLLEPGQRLRVVLNLYDFGTEADGFDFDMCLPDEAGTLRCADDDTG